MRNGFKVILEFLINFDKEILLLFFLRILIFILLTILFANSKVIPKNDEEHENTSDHNNVAVSSGFGSGKSNEQVAELRSIEEIEESRRPGSGGGGGGGGSGGSGNRGNSAFSFGGNSLVFTLIAAIGITMAKKLAFNF